MPRSSQTIEEYRRSGSPLGEVDDFGLFRKRRVGYWHGRMGPGTVWTCCAGTGGGRWDMPYCSCPCGMLRAWLEEDGNEDLRAQ